MSLSQWFHLVPYSLALSWRKPRSWNLFPLKQILEYGWVFDTIQWWQLTDYFDLHQASWLQCLIACAPVVLSYAIGREDWNICTQDSKVPVFFFLPQDHRVRPNRFRSNYRVWWLEEQQRRSWRWRPGKRMLWPGWWWLVSSLKFLLGRLWDDWLIELKNWCGWECVIDDIWRIVALLE